MIRLVEIEGKMNENGCIEVPTVVLEQTGIRSGETVKLIYMAGKESLENEAKEFLLVREGQDAGIPMDADLDIVCQEQKIIILPAETAADVEWRGGSMGFVMGLLVGYVIFTVAIFMIGGVMVCFF